MTSRYQILLRLLMTCACVCGVAPALRGAPPTPATPDAIAAMLKSAGGTKDYDKADVVYVLDEADVYVQTGGLATTETCQVFKILTNNGVRDKSVLRWDFDPDTNRVTVRSVRIHRAGGKVEEADVSQLATQPAIEHMIYWGARQSLLSLPRLEIGDAVEVRTSKIGFNIAYLSNSDGARAAQEGGAGLVPPMAGHWYEVTLFQDTHPILNKRYSVHMPKEMPVQYEVYNGPLRSSQWFGENTLVYTWTAEKTPGIKKEPNMVAPDDCVPKLVMATLGSWEEKSRWFHQVNEPQFDADDAIRAKVAEVVAGLKSDEEKIAAVTHWVADNVRYYGTKQGGACEGYTLHDSRKTFRDRGGVCKDKAGMLVTMLRVLGLEAYPALTMAGSRVEDIPADQFNHTVTALRERDGKFRILDPTWVPLSRDLWSAFEHLQGLVYGTPEGQPLTLSPYFDPESNRREIKADSVLSADGTLRSSLSFHLDGAACNRFRRVLNGKPAAERRAAFEQALNLAPNARLEAFEYTDPFDYTQDTHVKLQVSESDYAAGDGRGAMFQLPLLSHPLNGFLRASYLDRIKLKERKYAIRFGATRMDRYEETIKLPDGWRVSHMPTPRKIDTPSASLSFEAIPGTSQLTYRFEFALKKATVPVEDYEGFKKAVDAMYETADDWVVCDSADGNLTTARAPRDSGSGDSTGGR